MNEEPASPLPSETEVAASDEAETPGREAWFPDTRVALGFSLILALAATARFARLDFQSLWNDELSTMVRTSKPTLWLTLTEGLGVEANPPLYYVFMHYAQLFWGNSICALRTPTVLFGILTVVLGYRLGSVAFGYAAGLMTAGLLAVAPMAVAYSQEARAYAPLMTCCVAAALQLWRTLHGLEQGKRPWGRAVAFGVLVAVAAWFQYLGLVFGAMGFAFLLLAELLWQRKVWVSLAGIGATLAVFGPWIPTYVGQLLDKKEQRFPPPLSQSVFSDYVQMVWGQWSLLFWLGTAAAALALLPRRPWSRAHRTATTVFALFLLTWWWAPFCAAVAVSKIKGPLFHMRYMVFCTPAAAILAAAAMQRVPGRLIKLTAGAVWLLLATYGLVFVDRYYSTERKTPTRDLARWVDQWHNRLSGVKFVLGLVGKPAYIDHPLEEIGSTVRATYVPAYSDQQILETMDAIVTKRPNWLLVPSFTRSLPPDFEPAINRLFTQMWLNGRLGATLYVYKNDWLLDAPDDPLQLLKPIDAITSGLVAKAGKDMIGETTVTVRDAEIGRMDSLGIYETSMTLQQPAGQFLALVRPRILTDVWPIADISVRSNDKTTTLALNALFDRGRLLRNKSAFPPGVYTVRIHYKGRSGGGEYTGSLEAVRFGFLP